MMPKSTKGERESGPEKIRADEGGMEVEEEDLYGLLMGKPMKMKGLDLLQKEFSTLSIPIVAPSKSLLDVSVAPRPSLGSSRANSSVGRYESADWSPTPDIELSGLPKSETQEVSTSTPPTLSDEAEVIAHDFAQPASSESSTLIDEDIKSFVPDTHPDNPLPPTASVTSTPSIASGILTSAETATATTTSTAPSLTLRKPRAFIARIITVRRPGRNPRRGIRIIRRLVSSDIELSDLETSDEAPPPPPEPLPSSQFISDVVGVYGRETFDKLKHASKLHNTSGDLLPQVIRDLLPHLSDRKQALALINEVRSNLDIPLLSPRLDRVKLIKALAQMRERLYLELASAFVLPLAPEELPPVSPDEEEEEDKMSMSMTPSSFDTLSRTLPVAFPSEAKAVKGALEGREGLYGEEGDVVWVGGVGSMKKKLKDGEVGLGYRGGDAPGLVHVFVDHSNILHGLSHHLYSSPLPLPPRHQRILSLPCLSLLLRRGRPTRSSHLVASSPLHQDFDPLVRLNWEVSILKRVEIYESEVKDSSASKLTPKAVPRAIAGGLGGGGGIGGGTRRYKEQGVDEILTLKMLQVINRVEVTKGSTIVLATGDAKGGQFNQEGFLGAVREAVGRGWNVELWSFSSGLSRTWRDTARREKWDGRFRIHTMDEWAGELVEVNEEKD